MRPFGSRVRPPPPAARARSGPRPMSHPSAPRHVSPSQWLHENCLPSVRGHCICARSYPPVPINPRLRLLRLRPQSRTSEESVPSPTRPCLESAPDACAAAVADARRVRAQLHVSAPGVRTRPHASAPGVHARSHQSAPGPTHLCPLARVRAQRGRAFTSRRTWPIARVTSAGPQSFPAGAPCSCVRPKQYINPFALPHKSLCSRASWPSTTLVADCRILEWGPTFIHTLLYHIAPHRT
jgi:hypothetical protein